MVLSGLDISPSEVEKVLADAQKLYQMALKIKETTNRGLIPPSTLTKFQADGYHKGSRAAFKRVREMAEFVLSSLESLEFKPVELSEVAADEKI